MSIRNGVHLEPGEGIRYRFDDDRLVITHRGFDVRFGESFDINNGGYLINTSGRPGVVYLNPPPASRFDI